MRHCCCGCVVRLASVVAGNLARTGCFGLTSWLTAKTVRTSTKTLCPSGPNQPRLRKVKRGCFGRSPRYLHFIQVIWRVVQRGIVLLVPAYHRPVIAILLQSTDPRSQRCGVELEVASLTLIPSPQMREYRFLELAVGCSPSAAVGQRSNGEVSQYIDIYFWFFWFVHSHRARDWRADLHCSTEQFGLQMHRSRRDRAHANLQQLLKEIIQVDSMLERSMSIAVLISEWIDKRWNCGSRMKDKERAWALGRSSWLHRHTSF